MFPNPTQDSWEIAASGNIITKLELYDILGKNIKSITANTINVSIDAKDLETGVYFVKVYSGNEIKVIRLVKD